MTASLRSTVVRVFLLVAVLLGTSDSFKLLGLPRFLSNASPSVASSVAGQEITRTTPSVRELEPISVGKLRELLSVTDADFSQNVLQNEGLSIVLFTR